MGMKLQVKNKDTLLSYLPTVVPVSPSSSGPLPGLFTLQPISFLTPPRNKNSHEISHNTTNYSLVVKWTANQFKVNAVLNGSCEMLPSEFKWATCHHTAISRVSTNCSE
jgi:hypothetical protein